MEQITYKEVGATITVRVGKRVAGAIKPDGEGYRYYPANSRLKGDLFKTVDEVKQSLEEA